MLSILGLPWPLLAVSLLVGACSQTPPAPPTAPGDATIEGVVVSLNTLPMTYDGSAILTLRTDAGERTVQIPARMNMCDAVGLDVALAAEPGQRLRVTGALQGSGAVVPCRSSAHVICRL